MMTGQQYRASLQDGRITYFEGQQVKDLNLHPILGDCVTRVAADYDRLLTSTGPASMLTTTPRSQQDLRDQIDAGREAGLLAHMTYSIFMTLTTAAGKLSRTDSTVSDRIYAYVDDARQRDVRITGCITDAKGDRSRAPGDQEDPDAYLHVVDRRPGGIVIRGAKLHITAASLGHELMVIPTKAMKANEAEYSVACMVPVNASGVRIVDTTCAPRVDDVRSFPVSSANYYPEAFVIFDDVFVPTSRVLFDGNPSHAAVFAHSLGLWERIGGLSSMADDADLLVGLAQLVAEANGLARVSHIKDKIAEMIIHATLLRATLEAAISHSEVGDDGAVFPSELYTNAGKYHGAASYPVMVRHLQDIAGGSVLTAPSIADLENAEVGPFLRKYLSTGRGVDGEWRARLFHTIRDLTADAYGGHRQVTNIQSGGGLYAQRIVTRKHYDLEQARELARAAIEGHVHI